MSEEYTELVPILSDADDGKPYYLIQWKPDVEYNLSFNVVKVVSWHLDNKPYETEPSMRGWVKWDNCMDIICDEGNFTHFCYRDEIERHAMVMSAIYDLASKTIIKWDAE